MRRQELNRGWDGVYGSRFMKGGGVIDCPRVNLTLNRLANLFICLYVWLEKYFSRGDCRKR